MKNENINPFRIMIKALLILLIFNFAFPLIEKMPVQQITLYNHIVRGRERLPFGENPQQAYNLTMNDLDAMLLSHEISKRSADDSLSVVIGGDSSVWGTLLENEDTISAKLEQKFLDKNVHVYNLGYPTTAILKDLVLLDASLACEPDMVIWFITLNSLIRDAHKDAPILINNPEKTNAVITGYDLSIPLLPERTFLDKTFFNQRRNIHDRIQLQLFAAMWGATGIDQFIPQEFNSAARDLENDDSYLGITDHELNEQDLELEVVAAFIKQNPGVDVIIVNEPILISQGVNSDVRYNFYYPRWAYDQYRTLIATKFEEMGIKYIDLWDSVPEKYFTNSAIHYNAQGADILVDALYSKLEKEISLIE